MKITILSENQIGYDAAEICLAEWGFSAYVQTNGANILFDTGSSDVYWRNAKNLKIDLEKVDFIVLSHHHWDHSKGLQFHQFKTRKKLILHPQILQKLPANESRKIQDEFEVITSTKPLEFSKDTFYLGQIPRTNNFESGKLGNDLMLDDSALVFKTKNGAVVVSGCSHAGICNICEHAKKITGQKLYAVVGGFHLFEDDQKAVNGTIKYFKNENPKYLYPMHCVDFPTQAKLHLEFKTTKKSTGDIINF